MKVTDLSTLKAALYESIERLSKEDCDIEAETKRANAIALTAGQVVGICKYEFDATRLLIQHGFVPSDEMGEKLGLQKGSTKQITS